jgi:eukaryotic-like serine/threonine-protein kinase
MTLAVGTKLGPYEVVSALGSGGMGEVYRARDTRLGRDVAIKILPQHLSSNPDLKARFEREGRAVSALSHPHICHLYDIGSQDGTDYLVMELLEGESLADRLKKGPLPLKQALEYGIEIAEALEKAHKSGIVHRDLKPGNIMLTKSGAKLLDFGLAKPAHSMVAMASSSLETMSKPLTGEGKIVGTFQYMAPEQVHGGNPDARTDIFALGSVLYEMVTGKRAFVGKSQISVMSAILEKEPEPITATQPLAPSALEQVVRQCIAKDPDERIQTAHDVRLQLEWIRDAGSQAGMAVPVAIRHANRERWAWAVACVALLTAVFIGVAYRHTPPRIEAPLVRSTILPPEKATFLFLGLNGSAALSPDGRVLAFVARREHTKQIWVRPLNSDSARPLAGTENATQAFWSPDSRNLGFFAPGAAEMAWVLKRVPLAGGPPLTLCTVESSPRGGSWNRQDVIIFGSWPGVIYRVSASGGKAEKVTKFDPARIDTTQRWPQFLPDGNHFLYMTSAIGSFSEDNVFSLSSLDGKINRILFHGSSNIAYANGYLLYVVDKALMARPFDPMKLNSSGDAVPIADGLQYDALFSESVFSVSDNGVLVYQTGNASSARSLTLFDMNGKQFASLGEPGQYYNPRFSPDGKRLAYHLIGLQTGKADIWIQDLASASRIRLTVDPLRSIHPVWSRDGTQIAYISVRSGKSAVYIKPANGMAAEHKIWEPEVGVDVNDWTSDSKALILQQRSPITKKWRLVLFRLDGMGGPTPLLEAQDTNLTAAQLSPNGRWLAYQSDDSGKDEIYVSPFPTGAGRLQISVAGGLQPRWSGDGKQLFYLADDGKLMAAALKEAQGALQLSSLRPQFQTNATPGSNDSYDVAPDGKKFLLDVVATEETPTPLTLVENWTAQLRK